MAKQTEPKSGIEAFDAAIPAPPDEPAKPKTRLVNRNAHLKAASKIVAILQDVDPAKWTGILKIVQESLDQPQPVVDADTPLFNGEAK